jgi:hypothetical protein
MEYELTLELDQLYLLAVEFGGDVRLVVFGKDGELVGDVYFIHGVISVRVCIFRFAQACVGRKGRPHCFGLLRIEKRTLIY